MSGRKRWIAVAVLGAFALIAMTSIAGVAMAGGKAKTTLTIKYNGDGFQGKVKSKRARCVADRKVKIFKQQGSSQDPSSDQKIDVVTSDRDGHWDTGNSGQAHGKFYAYSPRTTHCRRGFSETIKA